MIYPNYNCVWSEVTDNRQHSSIISVNSYYQQHTQIKTRYFSIQWKRRRSSPREIVPVDVEWPTPRFYIELQSTRSVNNAIHTTTNTRPIATTSKEKNEACNLQCAATRTDRSVNAWGLCLSVYRLPLRTWLANDDVMSGWMHTLANGEVPCFLPLLTMGEVFQLWFHTHTTRIQPRIVLLGSTQDYDPCMSVFPMKEASITFITTPRTFLRI